MDTNKVTGEILAKVRAMNRSWTGWHEEQFRQFIHPDAVAIAPTTPGRLEGREANVAGWRAFAESAVVNGWEEIDPRVQIYTGGKCAVVTYLFTITFFRGTQKQTMRGRDMVFLVRKGRRWLVAADQSSPEPVGTGAG